MATSIKDTALWLIVLNTVVIIGYLVYSSHFQNNQTIGNGQYGASDSQLELGQKKYQLKSSGEFTPEDNFKDRNSVEDKDEDEDIDDDELETEEPFDHTEAQYLGLGEFFQRLYPKQNVLEVLGAYDFQINEFQFYSYPKLTIDLWPTIYGLHIDHEYCKKSDMYKISNPEAIFENISVLTSFLHPQYDKTVHNAFHMMNATINDGGSWFKKQSRHTHKFNNDTNFFITHNLEVRDYDVFGTAYGCFTQNLNHLVGNINMKKHFYQPQINKYALRHKEQEKPEQCFDKEGFMPETFRLYNQKECKEFFKIINSDEYKNAIKTHPNQYIIKVGSDSMAASGVYLLDEEEQKKLNDMYGKRGHMCGIKKKNLIAQKYLPNPLLIKGRKFDFRIYTYVASIDPMIVYYRDGFLRISVVKYDYDSNDRKQHLTNQAVSSKIIKETREKNTTYDGMTADELVELSYWSYEKFTQYLVDEGKIDDPSWLDTYLRPLFKKITYHYMKMIQPNLRKFPQTYDFYGFDVMMTDDLKGYFIEINCQAGHSSPKPHLFWETLLMERIQIQLAYYRSRMKRVFTLLQDMRKDYMHDGYIEVEIYRDRFKKISTNRLEPEYAHMTKGTNYTLIIDENRKGADAYFGIVDEECLIDYS